MNEVYFHYCCIQEFDDDTFYVRQGIECIDTENESDKEWVRNVRLGASLQLAESLESKIKRPAHLRVLRCNLMKEALSEAMGQKEKYLETLSEEDLHNYEKARKITYAILEQTI